jgi:dTDP-4-amino-4,6-dideoxygalactose transaminase
MPRVFLSPPDVGEPERLAIIEAFDSGWIAPVGPDVDAFEREFAARVGVKHAVAVSSGTAALHLALLVLGVEPGDEVLLPTFTFAASANVVKYVGARPVLIDSDPATWTVDPELVVSELRRRAAIGKLPKAVMTVDLYGQCVDYEAILPEAERYGIPVISDAAEALGATYHGHSAGSFGQVAAFSFNGNKIMTTSGGGMLVTGAADLASRAKYLSTQARQPVVHYEHRDIGFNYRLSNLLAALGRAQLRTLDEKLDARRRNNERYVEALGDLPGLRFMPIAHYGVPNYWLTCITVDPALFGADRDQIRLALEADDIEARPTWKPLHLQPVFAGEEILGGDVSAGIFATGLCLPSGSNLSDDDLARVVEIVAGSCRSRSASA